MSYDPTTTPLDSGQPFLDAVALIQAQQGRDGSAVDRILATADLEDLALVLGQMAARAVRTQGFTLDEFLTMSRRARTARTAGCTGSRVAYALGLIGLTTITASMSVLLWALEPVVILLLAALLLRERIPPALAVTLAVAISGALLVVYQLGASGDVVGITLTLVSIGFCALYTVLTRRMMLDDSSLAVVFAQQAAALVFAVAVASVVELAGGPGWDLAGLGTGVWVSAAVSGILYYGLGFTFYVTGLRHLPASYAGAFLPLIPVFGVAAGYLVGERLGLRQWIGAIVIVAATAAIAARHRADGQRVTHT